MFSYIVFFFVNNENNILVKEIKHVFRAIIAWWKPRQSLWKFSSSWKPSTASRVFIDLLSNSSKRSPRLSPSYEGTENMFYFLNEIIVIYLPNNSLSLSLRKQLILRWLKRLGSDQFFRKNLMRSTLLMQSLRYFLNFFVRFWSLFLTTVFKCFQKLLVVAVLYILKVLVGDKTDDFTRTFRHFTKCFQTNRNWVQFFKSRLVLTQG